MTKIIVKSAIKKQNQVTQFQNIGAQGAPTALGLGRDLFDSNKTWGQRAAAGLGLAGKGLAGAATVNQTAHQMQGGNLAAPLSAGYTFQGFDPSQMIQGTHQAYADEMKDMKDARNQRQMQNMSNMAGNLVPGTNTTMARRPSTGPTPLPQDMTTHSASSTNTTPVAPPVTWEQHMKNLGTPNHNPVTSSDTQTTVRVPQNFNQSPHKSGPVKDGTVINPTVTNPPPSPQVVGGAVNGAVNNNTAPAASAPVPPPATTATVPPPPSVMGPLLPPAVPVQPGTTPLGTTPPNYDNTKQTSIEDWNNQLPKQPQQIAQVPSLQEHYDSLKINPISNIWDGVNYKTPENTELKAAKDLLTPEGQEAAKYRHDVNATLNNQVTGADEWPDYHPPIDPNNPFGDEIKNMEITAFVDRMYDTFGAYLHKASPETAGALALRLFFGLE